MSDYSRQGEGRWGGHGRGGSHNQGQGRRGQGWGSQGRRWGSGSQGQGWDRANQDGGWPHQRQGQPWGREDGGQDLEDRGYRGRYGRERGGGGKRHRGGRDTHRSDFPPPEEDEGSQERRGRPPPGLKGREIGMWYARRSQAKKLEQEKQNRPTVDMDRHRAGKIRNLLNNIEGATSSSGSPGERRPASTSMYGKSKSPHSESEPEEDPGFKKECVAGAKSWSRDKEDSPPDYWEIRADEDESDSALGESFKVEVVPPTSSPHPGPSTSKPSPTEEEEEDSPDLTDAQPSVTGVLEYMKAHGELDFTCDHDVADIPTPVSDNPALDQELMSRAQTMESSPQFRKMMDFRRKLPSFEMRQTIVDAVQQNQALVISGETGCGKTTQVPQFILDDYISRGVGSQCRIICTQPRRISAISVAERVGCERCENVNDSGTSAVGYQIRLETKRPRSQGSILFCTTGIVLKFLENDPQLQRATHVIIDEIHERDLQSDFLMIILKDLMKTRRDLKVILMSATLNADMFSKYFEDCPMLNIPGFTFPVTEYLLEDVLEMTGYRPNQTSTSGYARRRRKRPTHEELELEAAYNVWCNNLQGRFRNSTIEVLRNIDFTEIDLGLIHCIVQHICSHMEDGAILIFVPGWEEIKKLNEMIQKTTTSRSGSLRVIPLHSLMPTVNQREVFERPPPGVRKIVIATNIAETSITIDDVVFVIDCGKIKVKDFQPEVNLTSLEPQWVSKANAKQRRGRAGRVQSGHCFHLYTAFQYTQCRDYLPPEMLRTRLEELCLQIKLLKLGRIVPFISKAMQHPSMEAISHAVSTLMELNALDHNEVLLPLGYHLARMPVEPHTGKMILFGAMLCCLDPILTVAASLSFKDAFTIPLGKEELADQARKKLACGSKSDHIMLVNAFQGWEQSVQRGNNQHYCWENFMSQNTLWMLKDMKKQLAELLYDLGFVGARDPKHAKGNVNSKNNELVRAVLCAGLYPNVAMISKVPKPGSARDRSKGVQMRLKGDVRVAAHPKSVNVRETFFESKWMVFYHMLKTSKVYIHDCTMVSPYPLLFFGGDINILKEDGQELVSVDDWVIFKASASTAQLVKDLRRQLDRVLTQKIKAPGPTDWSPHTTEGSVMAAILELITTENASGRDTTAGSIGYPPSQSQW